MKKIGLTSFTLLCLTTVSYAQQPHVLSVVPSQNELNVSPTTEISVAFDVNMEESSLNDSTFVVNSTVTGFHQGTLTYNNQTKTATLDPFDDFDVGEVVTIVLTTGIRSAEGIPLEESYIWTFTTLVNGGTGTFGPYSGYRVTGRPFAICAADLDRDDDTDLAVANWNASTVSILLNDGNAFFTLEASYTGGGRCIVAADLDKDGDLDLASTGSYSSDVSVLLNDGDGSFASRRINNLCAGPHYVFVADLNGDGNLDLTTASSTVDSICILLGYGDGNFAPYFTHPVSDYPTAIYAADLDIDGDLDLVTSNEESHDVSVVFNNGDGTFAPDSLFPVAEYPYSVVAADLDGDGDKDLATANTRYSDNISIILNDGNGIFGDPDMHPCGLDPLSIIASDLDGDGDLDLTVTNSYPGNVSVLLNYGNGSFGNYTTYYVGGSSYFVVSADFDGDGDLDLAATVADRDTISILLNEGLNGIIPMSDPLQVPAEFYLRQNNPNPFNPSTTISFDIPGNAGSRQLVSLIIYDIRGRRVKTLIDSDLEPGTHKIHWDGRNDRGEPVASGIYLYTLESGNEKYTRKMMVLK